MKRLFQHIIPFILLVLLLLANPCYIYSQEIVLERVSIEPTDSLRVFFNIEGEYSNIEELYIRFYPNLNDPTEHFDHQLDINDGLDQIIFFPTAAAHNGQLHFRLFAIFENAASRSKIHSAIFLQSIESLSEACVFSINAWWSNYAMYDGFDNVIQDPPFFNTVEVLMSAFDESEGMCMLNNEIILEQFDQALGDSEEIIDLSSISDISSGGRYCFRIRSINNQTNIYSYSNMWENIEIEELLRPEKVEISSVNVIDNEHIEIIVNVDENGSSQFEYTLQRTDNFNGVFEPLYSISHSGSELIFLDEDIPHFDNNPWFYRVVADMRDCPMDSPERSDILSSVFLDAELNFAFGSDNEVEVILDWDHYFLDGSYDYTLIKQLAGGTPTRYSNLATNSYTDILQFDQLGAEVTYTVEATRAGSTTPPVHSNSFLFSPEWLKPLPSAFRPGSSIDVNKTFVPEFYFPAGITGYSLSIYDRNGLRVFQTPPNVDPGTGWDGEIQATGQEAPGGAYIYEIRFDQAEKPVRGVVNLVR